MSHHVRARLAAALFTVTSLSTPAFAGTLVGSVVDAGGVRGLQGAEVELVELGRRTSAGPDGSFRFAAVPTDDGYAAIAGTKARWEGRSGELTPREGYVATELQLVVEPIQASLTERVDVGRN